MSLVFAVVNMKLSSFLSKFAIIVASKGIDVKPLLQNSFGKASLRKGRNLFRRDAL